MRIAIVNDYSMQHIGGAVVSMLEQKKALEKAGHTVIVLQLGKKPTRPTYDESGFIYIKSTITMPASLYNLPILFAGKKDDELITRILNEHEIEAVHLQSEMTLAHLVAKNAQQLSIPIFFTVHTFFWEYNSTFAINPITFLSKKLFEKAFRITIEDLRPTGNAYEKLLKNITLSIAARSKVVISPSKHQQKALQSTKLKTPVVVVPNPFETDNSTATFIESKPHTIRFTWIGRVVPEKRPLEFLEAAANAHKQSNVQFEVVVIGDGSILEEAQATFALPNVTYLGKLTHEETIAQIDESDMVCMSSYHFDNQPMIIAEAVSRFRPVFYCDEQLTEGVDVAGYRTEDETVAAMTKGIIDLIEHPQKIVVLSKKAEAAAALFAPKTFVKSVTKLYQE